MWLFTPAAKVQGEKKILRSGVLCDRLMHFRSLIRPPWRLIRKESCLNSRMR